MKAIVICIIAFAVLVTVLIVGGNHEEASSAPSSSSTGDRIQTLADRGAAIANSIEAEALTASEDPYNACSHTGSLQAKVDRASAIAIQLDDLGVDTAELFTTIDTLQGTVDELTVVCG